MSVPFTSGFLDWISLLRYEVEATGDSWTVTDHGETTYHVRLDDAEYVLTETPMYFKEHFLMAAKEVVDCERYLTWLMGASIRDLQGLRFIYSARKPEDINPGWSVSKSGRAWILWDATGNQRCTFNGDRAIMFSWIADAQLEDLRASYLDPDGLPLFPGCWIGPKRVALDQAG